VQTVEAQENVQELLGALAQELKELEEELDDNEELQKLLGQYATQMTDIRARLQGSPVSSGPFLAVCRVLKASQEKYSSFYGPAWSPITIADAVYDAFAKSS
jgi:chromosome segregation ATPase